MTPTRKTERLCASVYLDGETKASAGKSFATALDNLENEARIQRREVLFDTLNVSIERYQTDNRTLMGNRSEAFTRAEITVSAEAVKLPFSETTETTTENKE